MSIEGHSLSNEFHYALDSSANLLIQRAHLKTVAPVIDGDARLGHPSSS
ncbi:hypothetical protein [Paraburkholderia humisilvae]|nr:hypothetical protein [Paraburkholderia humisilvae]